MDAKSQNELYLIKRDLKKVINELYDVSNGIQKNFYNIGNDKAASCVSKVADKCQFVMKKLNNIDTSKVTKEFADAHKDD